MPSKRTTPRSCIRCGVDFIAHAQQVRLGRGFYCSRSCAGAHTAVRAGLLMVREDRFALTVDRDGPLPEQHPEFGPCWLWTGDITKQGYGLFNFDGSRQSSHRSAWEQVAGPIGDPSLLVCHTCDVRPCVRNDEIGTYEVAGVLYRRIGHLWLADQTANLADRDAKGRAPYQ